MKPTFTLLVLPESVSSCFSFCSMKKGGEGEETGVVGEEEDGHGLGGNVLLFSNTWPTMMIQMMVRGQGQLLLFCLLYSFALRFPFFKGVCLHHLNLVFW